MKYLLPFILLFCVPSVSTADLYLEPYLGYYMGDAKGSATVGGFPGPLKSDDSGVLYGGKLGWSFFLMAAGFDYMTGTLDSEDEGETTDLKMTTYGPFVQVKLPVMLKFSATMLLKTVLNSEDLKNTDYKDELSGDGMKFGIGFTGLPFVSINLDYITLKVDDASDPNITKIDVKSKAYMLSVSLPLEI